MHNCDICGVEDILDGEDIDRRVYQVGNNRHYMDNCERCHEKLVSEIALMRSELKRSIADYEETQFHEIVKSQIALNQNGESESSEARNDD